MRRYRAIVSSVKEPEDHEVIWLHNSKLYHWSADGWTYLTTYTPSDIEYNNSEYDNITNIEEAMDTLLYKAPVISNFKLNESGTYERGKVIEELHFSWTYNKKGIEYQLINDYPIPSEYRKVAIYDSISKDTTFTLKISDGTNVATSSASIKFVDYIYYGVSSDKDNVSFKSFNPASKKVTVTANTGQYIFLFIPNSAGLTKIVNNGVDSTTDFGVSDFTFTSTTGIEVAGKYYISKNHSLNTVTLNFE